jgi:hypothetical protein
MRAIASGVLDGKPAVVTEVVWNTGGSGNWEIVALFREEQGANRDREQRDSPLRSRSAPSPNYCDAARRQHIGVHALPDRFEPLTCDTCTRR